MQVASCFVIWLTFKGDKEFCDKLFQTTKGKDENNLRLGTKALLETNATVLIFDI